MPYRSKKQYKVVGRPLRSSGVEATYEYTTGNKVKSPKRK